MSTLVERARPPSIAVDVDRTEIAIHMVEARLCPDRRDFDECVRVSATFALGRLVPADVSVGLTVHAGCADGRDEKHAYMASNRSLRNGSVVFETCMPRDDLKDCSGCVTVRDRRGVSIAQVPCECGRSEPW